MITEKVEALGDAQIAAAMATFKGRDDRQVAWKVLRVYKKEFVKTGVGLLSELCVIMARARLDMPEPKMKRGG
jgi:hypothetical protein